jgi:S-adenosylmethionine synthetase
MARYIAKNLVAADLARRCEVQVAYAIGMAQPVSVLVDSFGTGVLPDEQLATIVREHFDLRPAEIIKTLALKRPIYRPTAAYGHFGRPVTGELFTWERIDRVEELKRAANLA